MNKKQIKRLQLLTAKAADSRTDEETDELETLQALAKAHDLDPATGEKVAADDDAEDEEDPDATMSKDDVKKLVSDAVGDSLKAIGLDADTVKSINERIAKAGEEHDEPLTAKQIGDIITEKIGGNGIDEKALIKTLEKKIKESGGLTEEQLDAKLKEFGEGMRKAPKQDIYAGSIELPIEHRSGNLSVAEKQLANICLQHVGQEGLDRSDGGHGIKRPADMNDGISAEQLKRAERAGEYRAKSIREQARYGKSLTSGTASSGAELVPTDLSSELLMRLYLESQLSAELVASEINMPTPVFQLPMRTTRTVYKVGSEGGTPTESSPGTSQVTLTAAKLIGQADYSYEADEDSIIAILPMLQEQLAEGAADALEDAIINGDTTATHQDGDTHAVANHAAKLFKGLRKYALAGSLDTSLATGGLSAGNVATLNKNMGKYGVKPQDRLILVGVNGYNDLIQLDETLTVDKVGAGARILTGTAPTLWGSRIIVSSQVREDLNASGVDEVAGVATKGSIIVFHRPSFILGVRRGFLVEVDVDKKTQLNSIIASFRRDFQPKETPSATAQMVVLGRNFES